MSLALWLRWLGWLAAETSALVAGAAILHLWLRSPRAGRTIWRTALAAVALVWMVELSGLRQRMAGTEVQRNPIVITATVLPASPPAITPSTEWPRRPATDLGNGGERSQVIGKTLAPGPPPLWPLWIWLGGTLLLLARFCVARVWLALRRRAAAPADEDSLRLMARWQASFRLPRVQAQVWAGLRGPVAFGVLRPTVALPPDFIAHFSIAEREAMLAHEMAHLAAQDPFWWMVSDAVVALAWWHPLVWWARGQLQSAHEAAADEASALVPGGARTLAECLVRLGRELTSPGSARALGIGGNGPRSQLAVRIERLLREPRAWRPVSVWARWMPQVSAMLVALASALLPIQTGLSGSILAVLASAAPLQAVVPQSPPTPALIINPVPSAAPPASATKTAVVPTPLPSFILLTNQPETAIPIVSEQPGAKHVAVASLAPASNASPDSVSKTTQSAPVNHVVSQNMGAHPPGKVSLEVKFVELTEHDSDDLGLDWIFGLAQTNVAAGGGKPGQQEPTYVPAFDINTTNGGLYEHAVSHPESLLIDSLRSDMRSAVLKPEQFEALLNRIEMQTESDILGTPACVAESGGRAHFADQTLMSIVTIPQAADSSHSKDTSIKYSTENIATGIACDIAPTLEDGGKWRLHVRASFDEFLGYEKLNDDKMATAGHPGGKPDKRAIFRPHIRVREAEAEDLLLPGQTLAVGGPLVAETTKTKGHFLAPAKTKTIRQRLYIFVTILPSPSEMKNPNP